jgi:hypothetical protein
VRERYFLGKKIPLSHTLSPKNLNKRGMVINTIFKQKEVGRWNFNERREVRSRIRLVRKAERGRAAAF